jgi:hypothetical protein
MEILRQAVTAAKMVIASTASYGGLVMLSRLRYDSSIKQNYKDKKMVVGRIAL